MPLSETQQTPTPAGVSRIAWTTFWLCCATVVVGAIETTLNYGMAIPGWPNSFRSLWIFTPLSLWFGEPDVFVAQTHRLLGYATLVSAILAVVDFHRRKAERPIRRLAFACVIIAGILAISGGLRVAWDQPAWANVHACLSVFSLLAIGLVAIRASKNASTAGASSRILFVVTLLFAVVLCVQFVAGAQLRHTSPYSQMLYLFPLWTWIHLIVGIVLFLSAGAVLWGAAVRRKQVSAVNMPSRKLLMWLSALVMLQFVLGLLNWIVQYNFPLWFMDNVVTIPYTVQEGSLLQTTVVTSHVLLGFTCVLISGWLVCRSWPASRGKA